MISFFMPIMYYWYISLTQSKRDGRHPSTCPYTSSLPVLVAREKEKHTENFVDCYEENAKKTKTSEVLVPRHR